MVTTRNANKYTSLNIIESCIPWLPEEKRQLVRYVINNPLFQTCVGSIGKHHSTEGGLLQHTGEVLNGCLGVCHNAFGVAIDRNVLIVAAVWHDYGKIFTYQRNKENGNWVYGPDAEVERHLTRSYREFNLYCAQIGFKDEDFIRAVNHCILSHHGRKEWGPEEPRTPEAWALHLSDMISVHCFDNGKTE